MEKEMQEYTVKVKDFQQNITHKMHFFAYTQSEANSIALDYLYKTFKHHNFEIV